MPTYTYQCALCKREFDIFQHFTDDTLQVCPECGKPALQKQYLPANVVFKGDGWYVKDKSAAHG